MGDDQGYANRGTDPRPLGAVGGRVQQALSFHSDTPPTTWNLGRERGVRLKVDISPYGLPHVGIQIPAGHGNLVSARAGWRFDPNWKRLDGTGSGYIADVAFKTTKHSVL